MAAQLSTKTSEQKLSQELRQVAHDIGVRGDPTEFHRLADKAAALEAKLEAMRDAATIAIVALADYNTSDNGLDNARDMLEEALTATQQEQEDE